MIRGLAALLSVLLLMWGVIAPTAGAAQQLTGQFYGIDGASGANLEVEQDGAGYRGRFTDALGNARDFEAVAEDGGASGLMRMDGREVVIRLTPVAFGVEALVVPVGEDGVLDTARGQIFAFIRRDIALPTPPQGYVEPPGPAQRRVGASGFLASYEFWAPEDVRDGYARLATRHRTLIRLFPAVQLDIIWKLCLAPDASSELGVATRGQGVNCADVREVIAMTQQDGRFGSYKAEVTAQGDVLRQAIRCGDNYVETKATCDQAAKEVSRMAVSLETAANVLDRYR
ncbi:MAG: hypothetical protein AAF675_06250 [Pseudomonadota bacterium]